MTGITPTRRSTAVPAPADVARYAAAVAAAADPDGTMDRATERFRDMAHLTDVGDRLTALGAANGVAEDCLRLCAVPAATASAAENKIRFLAIMSGWAWPRRPALAAIIDAAREAERRAWGGDLTGAA